MATPTHRRIGLAVSGGADSTALAVLMASLQTEFDFEAFVLHVDHGLRADSAADARFVRALARQLQLPFHSTRVQITRRPRESLEMAARRYRLDFFARMSKRLKLDAIATGHHADDVAETFILRLARGSGACGLAGLKPISRVNGITFIRPLLDLRDSQLKDFLRARGQPWREDSTNADTSIPRNKIRHLVLPWLRANLDPHITEHICKSAAILRGDLSLPPPMGTAPPQSMGTVPLRSMGTVPSRSMGTVPPQSMGTVPPQPSLPRYSLRISPATGYEVRKQSIGALPACCELSRAALAGRTLLLRAWQPGDRIAPTGMHGRSRKLQDVFVTAKVPPALRTQLPVLVDAATGEVLWLPGYRIAESVAVESPTSPSWRLELTAQ